MAAGSRERRGDDDFDGENPPHPESPGIETLCSPADQAGRAWSPNSEKNTGAIWPMASVARDWVVILLGS